MGRSIFQIENVLTHDSSLFLVISVQMGRIETVEVDMGNKKCSLKSTCLHLKSDCPAIVIDYCFTCFFLFLSSPPNFFQLWLKIFHWISFQSSFVMTEFNKFIQTPNPIIIYIEFYKTYFGPICTDCGHSYSWLLPICFYTTVWNHILSEDETNSKWQWERNKTVAWDKKHSHLRLN